jgi:hypothetical protein
MMPTKEHFDRLRSLSLRNFAGILRPGGSGGLNEGRLEAWGGDSNFFNQGAAKQSEDPDVVAASGEHGEAGCHAQASCGFQWAFQEDASYRSIVLMKVKAARATYWIGREQGEVEL